ncbi:MAG: nuclear transport factor 2 family protein [Pseudomonadota bacterium]
MTRAEAEAFARAWIAAWNDKDLGEILSHYADNVVFHSPRIADVLGEPKAALTGIAALRAYWEKAAAGAPDLYFELDAIFTSSDALTVLYTNHRDQQVTETFLFDAEGKVRESVAAYA